MLFITTSINRLAIYGWIMIYFLLTIFAVSQVLYLATAVSEGSASGPVTVVQMCQQPWLHPQL